MSAADDLLQLIRERRSVRSFADEPVDKDAIAKLVEAAAWAPSAGNRQDWLFAAVLSAGTKREMAEIVRRRWGEIIDANRDHGFIEEFERYAATFADFEKAPAVIVVAARKPDAIQLHLLGEEATAAAGGAASAAMAAQNLMLAAHALGLGTCCMTGALAARGELASLLGLGRRMEIVCLIALGRPAGLRGPIAPPAPPRKPITEILRFVE